MKTISRKWLPAFIFAIATIGAFSTHAMSLKAKDAAIVQRHIKLNPAGTSCQQADDCSTVETDYICTVNYEEDGTPLFLEEGNQCTVQLYRPEQP